MVSSSSCRYGAGVKTTRQSSNSSRVRNPAPLGCVHIFLNFFVCIIYIYFFFEFFIEARLQPGTPLFNLKIIISVCDTHEIRTYNKGQHQKLIRRVMFSCIRATHTRYARTMKGKIPITKEKKLATHVYSSVHACW